MSYEILFKCPFCEPDTAGNHAWNCPNSPNKIGNLNDLVISHKTTWSELSSDEFVLERLKQSGKRLKEALGITEEDIDKAIKELRREW